jgi:hypothetical protein
MKCNSVQHAISAFVDGVLPRGEERVLSLHLGRCRKCAQLRDQTLRLRAALHNLPAAKAPSRLTAMLRVAASRERVRRLEHAGTWAGIAAWGGRAGLWADNLMRPLALPFAGGVLSALILLGLLVPTFYVRQNGIKDVPFGLSTDAAVKAMSPFGFVDEDVCVIVRVNEQGRMIDYSIPGGQVLLKDPDLRRGIENALLFAEFTPARNGLGQPVSGPIRLYLRRSQVVVRG